MSRRFDHEWHVALNRFNEVRRESGEEFLHWIYTAKSARAEMPRLANLFKLEREMALPKIHQQCSMSEPEPIRDNHLSCCLGVKCAECPFLAMIETAQLSDEQKDEAKAWTCVTHIISEGGDQCGEGFVLTVDDRMYWNNVHQSLTSGYDADDVLATPPTTEGGA
jgi:hypothetical protein